MLTHDECTTITNTQPFEPPTCTPPLDMPSTATSVQALQLKNHAEANSACLERKNIDKAILRHVQDALEEKHIEALVDQHTNLLTDDAPKVLECLFYNYGKVSSEEVSQKESEAMPMTCIPSEPLIVLIRPLKQLKKLAEDARIPYTDAQILQKGLSLTRATRDFEHTLSQWDEKSDAKKVHFKTNFHQAHLQSKDTRGPTIHQT